MMALSPSGDAVALVANNGALVVDTSGNLTSYNWRPPKATGCQVRWSADGQTIAFAAGSDAIVAKRGGARIADLHHVDGIAFTPDSKRLLFGGHPAGHPAGIQSLDLATGAVHTIVPTTGAYDPVPSPTKLAYTVQTKKGVALWVAALDGRAPRLVADRYQALTWLNDDMTVLAVHPGPVRGVGRIVRISPGGSVTGVMLGQLIGVSRIGSVALVARPLGHGYQLFVTDLSTGLRAKTSVPPVLSASWTG
jgi:hypothetical protein